MNERVEGWGGGEKMRRKENKKKKAEIISVTFKKKKCYADFSKHNFVSQHAFIQNILTHLHH